MNGSDRLLGAVVIALADGTVIYWNQRAAAEFGWPGGESPDSPTPGLVSTASDSPNAIHAEGVPGSEVSPQPVKVILKSGKTTLLYSRMMPLMDAGGRACGHLYLLQRSVSGEPASKQLGPAPTVQPGVSERQVLHQLNNVFASIHSGVELALDAKSPAESAGFLQQARESARKGALIINELQLREREAPGAGALHAGDVLPNSTVLGQTGDDQPPAALEGKERLLLAEDNKSMRALIRAVLTYRGYTVIEAVDGEEAVTKFIAEGPFDLLIVDMGLPKLEGDEVLRRVRARNPEMRALALSGNLFDGGQEAVELNNRFNGFLKKPFRNLDLVKQVRRILDLHATG